MHHVRFWVYDDILASGVTGPIDVLTAANRLAARQSVASRRDGPLFEWRVESLDGKPVRTASGQFLNVDGPLNMKTAAHAIIVTAPFVEEMPRFMRENRDVLRPLLEGLHRQHKRGALLGTYCSGSYLLAEAGLLDGRIATTHWSRAKEFAQLYPQVNLQIHEVITEQERIFCAGAVISYLNLALKIVERLAGQDLAIVAARLLLIDTNRISQTSYAIPADAPHADPLVARAQEWLRENYSRSFRLSDLAGQLGSTERTLNRRFKEATGDAPLRFLQSLRIEAAKSLLERRQLPLETICERVGYGDVSAFRQLFKRMTGLSPRDYQRQFGRRVLGAQEASAQ